MQGEQKCGLTAATTYTVDEAGADGYVVELKADDYSTTGNADLLSMVGGQFFETLKSTPAKLKLDKKGAITGLANEDAFIAAISSTVVEGINKMYADRPGLESQMPKAKLLMAANSQLTWSSSSTSSRISQCSRSTAGIWPMSRMPMRPFMISLRLRAHTMSVRSTALPPSRVQQ